MQPEDDPLLKLSDVAEKFSVKPSTVRDWIKQGKIKGVKIGNGHYWRVPQSEVVRYARELYGE